MDTRDQILQSVTPTVMVPRFGDFELLNHAGHRFLAAANGLWLEVWRPWLHVITPLAINNKVAMPYGQLSATTTMLCGELPLNLMQEFSRMAKARCPQETAAWMVWNENSGQFRLVGMLNEQASEAAIRFNRPRLNDNEHLVVDLHSHGCLPAFFSRDDNKDDQGEIKVSLVLGNCHKETVSTAIRLCLLGKTIPLDAVVTANGGIQLKEKTWNTSFTPRFFKARSGSWWSAQAAQEAMS